MHRKKHPFVQREKDEVEKDVGKDIAAGKTLNKVKRKNTEKQRKRELEGGLNHNRLLNFTRSRFTKDSRDGPVSPTQPHTFNKVMTSGF